LRLTVLPQQERARIADQIQDWLPDDLGQKILNIRNPEFRRYASLQDAASYVQYLRSAPDETHLLPELGAYLRRLDSSRGLNVLDYLPEYEHIFRTARYQTNH